MKDCRIFTKSITSVFSFGEREIEVAFNVIAELTTQSAPHQSFTWADNSASAVIFPLMYGLWRDENVSAMELSYTYLTHCIKIS